MALKNYLKVLSLLLLCLLISSCSSWPKLKQIEIKTVQVERVIPTPNRPRPLNMNDIKFYVVTSENFEEFKEAFTGAITDHLEGKKPIIELLTDGRLDASEMTLNNAELLRQASPWGQGFEEPIFYGDFELLEQRIVGEKHLKCTLKLVDNSSIFEGIAFFQEKLESKQVRVAYKLNVNSFRGNESLQLMIESIVIQ